MGLIYVVWGLFLVLMPVASFLNVCWSLSSWQGMCKCNSWFLVLGFSEAVAAQACPQNTWWEQRYLLTTLGVCKDRGRSSQPLIVGRQQRWLITTPGDCAGSVRPSVSMCKGKRLQSRSFPSPMHPWNNGNWPLRQPWFPFHTPSVAVTLDSSLPKLFPHSQSLSSLCFISKALVKASKKTVYTHGCTYQAGECRTAALTISLPLLWLPQTGCCIFLWGFEAPLLSQLISLPVRGFPGYRNISSFTAPSQEHRSHPNSFLFFFFPTQSHEDFLALSASEVFCQLTVDILWESFHM